MGLATPLQQTIATETDDQRNTQPQDEGDGYQPGAAGRMTAQRTIRPLLIPKSKCHIGTWNVRTMFQTGKTAQVMPRRCRLGHITWRRTIEAKMRTAGKTWKELDKAAMDRELWKSPIAALCAT